MQKFIFISASVLGGLGVAIGAFGAHAFRPMLEASNRVDTFETGIRYQFFHVFLLIVIGLIMNKWEHDFFDYAGLSAFIGIIIFSGSIYGICFTGISKLGMITPIGGLFLIASWVLLGLGIWKTV